MACRRLCAAILALTAAACTDGTIGTPASTPSTEPPELRRVEGAPVDGDAVDRVPVLSETAPKLISVVDGVVAVGTAEGLLVGSTVEHDLLTELPVVPDDGGPEETGGILRMARRTSGGVLVAADSGLFHSATGMLLASPLGASIDGASILSLDAIGEGEAEELWIVTAEGLTHVGGGELTGLSIPGTAVPEAAVAVGPAQAMVVAEGSAFLVDAAALTAMRLTDGLGAVHAFDRADDGAAHLATDAGLLSRSRDGALTLRTLAAAGEPAAKTLAVTAAFGALFAATEGELLLLEGDDAIRVGEITAVAGGVAIDATGDAWAIDDGDLYRYRTGEPVSFDSDVRPFFVEHCTKCHSSGEEGAPKFDLEVYEEASERATLILSRLRAIGVAPMPPTSVEVLTAADYAVVTRWVASGVKP